MEFAELSHINVFINSNMPLAPDTSKVGLFIGGSIVAICLVVLSVVGIKVWVARTTDLPFPKVEASDDLSAMKKSANDGNAESQLKLAGMFYTGKGGAAKDTATSIQWLTRSAEQGNATAELILGVLYFRGEAVSKDLPTAKEWFAKAGHQGNAEAQYYLGIMFEQGLGVPVDNEKAYLWLNLAKAQGHEKASAELTTVSGKMTTDQIAAAQKMTTDKQAEIAQNVPTPENSVSKLLKEAQQAQDDLKQKADAAEAELERIKNQDGDASKVLKQALPSVVTILVPAGDGEVSQGTAFFVDDYTLITNFHVVEPEAYENRIYALGSGPPAIIIDDQKRTYIAEVIATGDSSNDLAALALSNVALVNHTFITDAPSPYPALSLQTSPRQGQTVFAVGSPQSFAESITKGIISAVRSTNTGMEYIQTDTEITHGNSGGPLLNTSSEVVGVNTLSINDVKFAIAASSVKQFLNDIPSSAKGMAYLDPSDFNSESSGTQKQPTYRPTPSYPTTTTTDEPTAPTPRPAPEHDCSQFGSHAFYSYTQASCVCDTGYYASNNTCLKQLNCVANSTFNTDSKQCECNYGYYMKNGKCYTTPDCPYNSSFYVDSGKCYCDAGYVSQNGTCVSEYSACGFGGTYNRQTGRCDCLSGYYMKNGTCTMEPSCYGGDFDPQTGGCICDKYHYPKDGSCVFKPSCGDGGYFDESYETCVCNPGYTSYGTFCSKDYN